jgi:hypothetical protein
MSLLYKNATSVPAAAASKRYCSPTTSCVWRQGRDDFPILVFSPLGTPCARGTTTQRASLGTGPPFPMPPAFDNSLPPRVKAKQKGRRIFYRIVLLAYGALRFVLAALALGYLLAVPVVVVLAKVTARRQDHTDHKWDRLLWRYTHRTRRRSQTPRVR